MKRGPFTSDNTLLTDRKTNAVRQRTPCAHCTVQQGSWASERGHVQQGSGRKRGRAPGEPCAVVPVERQQRVAAWLPTRAVQRQPCRTGVLSASVLLTQHPKQTATPAAGEQVCPAPARLPGRLCRCLPENGVHERRVAALQVRRAGSLASEALSVRALRVGSPHSQATSTEAASCAQRKTGQTKPDIQVKSTTGCSAHIAARHAGFVRLAMHDIDMQLRNRSRKAQIDWGSSCPQTQSETRPHKHN